MHEEISINHMLKAIVWLCFYYNLKLSFCILSRWHNQVHFNCTAQNSHVSIVFSVLC